MKYSVSHYLILGIFILLTLGCSSSKMSLSLDQGIQRVPSPTFLASRNKDTKPEQFEKIRVFELVNDCDLTSCPIAWEVALGSSNSIRKFVYGGFPGFGSQTIIPAQPLRRGGNYTLQLIPSKFSPNTATSELNFFVARNGEVYPKGKSE